MPLWKEVVQFRSTHFDLHLGENKDKGWIILLECEYVMLQHPEYLNRSLNDILSDFGGPKTKLEGCVISSF